MEAVSVAEQSSLVGSLCWVKAHQCVPRYRDPPLVPPKEQRCLTDQQVPLA